MQLSLVSFNGTNLNDGTNFMGNIVAEQPMSPSTTPIWVSRAGAWPILAGKEFQGQVITLEITCQGNYNSQLESLIKLFAPSDETPRQLIFKDTANSNKQYYIYASCFQISEQTGPTVTVSLGADDPEWQSVTQNSSTWTITSTDPSSDWTTSITANGNDDSWPIFEVTPTSTITTGWFYLRYALIVPTSVNPWTARCIDITGGGLDTATLIAGGKMLVTGNDIRVYQNGVEVDYWFGTGANAINQAATKIWCVLDMPPAYSPTIKTAIASTDTVTEIEFNYTIANKAFLTAMPAAGLAIIDSEEFTYTAKTVTATKLAITVNARSTRNTAAANHTASTALKYIPYDISILYGNTAAAAPDIDNAKKPVIDLTSTNSSLVYTVFADNANLRAASWIRQKVSISNAAKSTSKLYSGVNDGGDVDPANIAGMQISSYKASGKWKPETSVLHWIAPFPDTVTSISFSGEQYQTTASFPAIAGLHGSPDGVNFASIQNVAGSTSSTDFLVWRNWAYATTDLTIAANTNYLKLIFSGNVKGTDTNLTRFGPTAITVNLTNPPTVTLRAEQTIAHFDVTLSNVTTGENLQVRYALNTSQTIYIDTDPDFPTAKFNGQIVNGALKANTIRPCPLKLQPGANTLLMTANYSGSLSIVVKWRDRMLYL